LATQKAFENLVMKIAYKNVYIYLQNYIKGTSCKTVKILIIIKPKQQ
jgi:hypothetical protein